MDGPSVAERSRAGCKEQRSAEYWRYSSERRRRRRPGEGAAKPRGQEAGRGGPSARRASARYATPGGYARQAPSPADIEGLSTVCSRRLVVDVIVVRNAR